MRREVGEPGRRGGPHYAAGTAATRGGAGERHGASGGCGMATGKKKRKDRNPLAPFYIIAKRSRSCLVQLSKALNQFYKIYKNSCGLHLTFSTSTKICVSK